jgi:hypothetical protein
VLKEVTTAVMIIHGLIHLLGFIKAFQFARVGQFTQTIPKSTGILWLIAASLFIAAALIRYEWWWMVAIPALVLSQVLIFMHWQDAKYGTIANMIILVGIVIGYGTWML